MKLRVLYYTKAGISEEMITYLSREYRVKADSIPPAYPMEIGRASCRERV